MFVRSVDAIVRQRLLNDYEEARQRDLQNFEAAIQEQNRAIQAEMERMTSQYMARMQSNLDEVARAQAGAPAAAGRGLTVVLERASSAAGR